MGHRPAVFIDRDGTLTEEVGYVNHPSRLRLLPRSAEAIRCLNAAGVAAVVVLDLAASTMVGDKASDLVPARSVGAGAVLVLTGYGLGEWEYRREDFGLAPDHVAGDLLDAVEWVLARRPAAASRTGPRR